MTVCGKVDRLNNITPIFSADFLTTPSLPPGLTFSRAGGAMYFDSTGKITWAPENLLVRSQEFATTWTPAAISVSSDISSAPDGTLTADKLKVNTTNTVHNVLQTMPATIGYTIWSCYFKAAEYDKVMLYTSGVVNTGYGFDLTNGTMSTVTGIVSPAGYGIMSVGDGWYRCWIITDARTSARIYLLQNFSEFSFAGANTTDGLLVWGAQLERITYETEPRPYNPTTSAAYYGPRFDYDPVTHAPLGYLNEQGLTNAASWCRDFTNAVWVKAGMSAAKDQIGIDSVSGSASKITATSGNGTVLQSATYINNSFIVFAWAKRLVGSGIIEMTTDNGLTWIPVTITSEWSKISIPRQILANPVFGFRIQTYGDSIAVDFFQTILGLSYDFHTSPIWTTVSTTRASDIVTGNIATMNFNDNEETLIVEADSLAGAQLGHIAGFRQSGSASNYNFGFWQSNSTISGIGGLLTGYNRDGTTATSLNSGITISTATPFRIGIRQNQFGGATGFAISVNGGAIIAGQVRDLSGASIFDLASRNSASWFNGHIRSFACYNRAPNDNFFKAKTTVGAAY